MSFTKLFLVVLGCATALWANAAVIFPIDSEWKYLRGLTEASSPDPTSWRAITFDDSNWTIAPSPFWYGEAQPSPGTELIDMRNQYTSIFMRRVFLVNNPADISELQLGALSDDGFIAWINGNEVARFNMPDGPIPATGTSLPALQEPIPFETYPLPNPAAYLVPGANVIAIHAFNASLGNSSDFVINVSLSGSVDDIPPSVADLIPPATATVRELTEIEVRFSEAVRGVDAADLLINGNPTASVTEVAPGQFIFEFPDPPAGKVQVAWSVGHGIKDLAGAPNAFGGGNWSYTLDPNAPAPGVIISEFVADNKNTINDEDGDPSDWIEIYNAGTAVAELNGWFLTDQTNNLTKWRFPNIAVPPSSYLLVFASEKNQTNPQARLHTNFKLEKDGEYLALVDSQTNLISEFAPAYPAQQTDVSYGRDRAAPELLGYFLQPTPGTPNSNGGPGFSSAIGFSRSAGTFINSFSLALSTPSINAVIRYTLNGTLPSETSPVYTSPIAITSTVQVRARAFEPGLLPGAPRSESYVALDPNVINFSSDLPILVIHNFGAGSVPANQEQLAFTSIFEPETGRASLTNNPNLSTRSAINIRGSSTQGYPKSSFAVEWRDEFNQDKKLPVLGMPAEADWILYAPNNFEPVLIHNPFIFELSNQIGRYAPRTRFVEVYLNTGGGPVSQADYNGIYVLMEKIKRGKDRVEIDGLEPEHITPPTVTGGYLMKIDRLDPGDNGFDAAGQNIAYVDPKELEIELPQRNAQEQYIRNYMNSFGTALNSASYTNSVTGYAQFVDIDSWIDHHILNVLACNVDALRLSAYFYKPREGKLAFGPIWDFDRALGSTDGRDANPRVWRGSGDGTDFFNYPWWSRLFRDPDFFQKWIDRWQDLRLDQFSTNHINSVIDSLVNQVRQAQVREQTRWGVQPRGGSYQREVDLMKNWLRNRINFIDTNFVARPLLSRTGGEISAGFSLNLVEAPGATTYFTLDGSDPRMPGGSVSPKALTYASSIPLMQNARVVARSYNVNHRNLTGPGNPPISSPWSGSAAATFVISSPPLIITEIMYHPQPSATGDTNAAENFEYVELKNRGTAPLNLVGFQFTKGIDYRFDESSAVTTLQAGEYVVLVKDLAAFTIRYGPGRNVAGEYQGSLDNGGERLILEGPLKEPILDFNYRNDWHPITDGLGFSLVVADENAPLNNWTNKWGWRPSGRFEGSPGQTDPFPPNLPGIVVNEALTQTDLPQVDAIEIYNPTADAANLGGWFLTDDFSSPRKFWIPAGTRIPAGGFLVFSEVEFGSASSDSFSLSALGDQVYLFSGDALTNLTGYAHGFSFGAAENGVTFGRHVTSTGEEHFVAQVAPSLNATNAGPRVGPVVINEIMYHPPATTGTNNNTIDEYLELHNISDQTVLLYDPNASTNTWRITGGVKFGLPQNLSLAPNAYLLIVGFHPLTNATDLAAFRNRYSLAQDVPIIGPYEGKLENSGEQISLLKPDSPQGAQSPNPGFVPYVLMDEVNYSNAYPWPMEADGTGQSLQRLASSTYGNDPINWQAALPTPGKLNPGSGLMDSDGDGLADSWELAHGLNPNAGVGDNGGSGDPDHDGLTNLQEYLSGTDPQNSASGLRIRSISRGGASTLIRFSVIGGRSYSIEYREALAEGPWLKLTDVGRQPATGELQIEDAKASSVTKRFYRLATPSTIPR